MKIKPFLFFLVIFLSFFSFIQFPNVYGTGANWLTGWGSRKSHIITNSTGAGANYQICVKVYKTTGTDGTESYTGLTIGKVYVGSYCRDDFGDIRFTDDDGDTELKHWIETSVSGTNAVFWIKVADNLESANQTIYVYYNNPSATNNDDYTNTFVFFDDFDGTTPNTSVWTVQGSPTCSNSVLHIVGSVANGIQYILSKTTFGAANVAVRSYAVLNCTDTGTSGEDRLGFGNGGATDSEAVWLVYNTPDYGLNYKGSAGATVPAGTHTLTSYYIWEVEWQPTTVKYRRNGDSYDLATDTPIVALSVWLRGRQYSISEIDANWVLVRKFIALEPIHSTWGTQELFASLLSSLESASSNENGIVSIFSCYWIGININCSGFIFQYDISGSAVNDSWTAFPDLNNTWSNVTKTLMGSTLGVTVSYLWYANDSNGAWFISSTESFVLQATLTFYHTDEGIIRKNNTVVNNGTSATYTSPSGVELTALANSTYEWLSWNWTNTMGSTTTNIYIFSVLNQSTVWCYFAVPSGGGIFIYARFIFNDSAPYQDQDAVFFNASSSNCSSLPLFYYWDFGDTDVSTGETTIHIYLNSGIFIVNLTVVNGAMQDSLLQNITVFATSINITFDWNDLLFGSGAWIPFIVIMILMFIGVAINKFFIVVAFPVMVLMSFLYFDNITTTPSLVWEALIMILSAIVLLIYSLSKKQ
jgi:PKD repeat protein